MFHVLVDVNKWGRLLEFDMVWKMLAICSMVLFQMEYNDEQEEIIEPDADGGWVDTHHHEKGADLEEKVLELTIDSPVKFFNIRVSVDATRLLNLIYFQDEIPNNFMMKPSDGNPPDDDDDNEEVLDMDEYEESGLLDADDDVIILKFFFTKRMDASLSFLLNLLL